MATPNRDDYAYTPGDNVSEWKLDISTRDNAIRAAMALGPKGYRGNQVQIPESDLLAVKRKVSAALRKFGVPSDSVVWQHVKASETPPESFASPDPTEVAAPGMAVPNQRSSPPNSMTAFLAKLYALIKSALAAEDAAEGETDASGAITRGDFDKMVAQARGHAGGKGKAAARQANEPIELADLCATVGEGEYGLRLFNELAQFAEPPEWIPCFPKPGAYKHPRHGLLEITPERTARYIDSFKRRVYQEHIPLDAEHETKLSGALGYFRDFRLNPDGSADTKIEWTDRGAELVRRDRFKYFSPEWHDAWPDPLTGEKHSVFIGGALTTRPWFKDKYLQPIVASERGLEAAAELPDFELPEPVPNFHALAPVDPPANPPIAPNTEETVSEPTIANVPVASIAPIGMTEDQAKRFAELEQQATSFKQMVEQQAEQLKQATEQVATLRRAERTKRFTDIVLGRGDAGDGAVWFGDPKANVSRLEKFAEVYGEDSDELRAEVERERAIAAQLKSSALYSQFSSNLGHSAGGSSTDTQIQARVKQMTEANPKLTPQQALLQLIEREPELYGKSLRENGQ